jgi:hypothetical protein
MIRILSEDASLCITHIIVNLESQLMVCHFNRIYSICNPTLLCLYLRVHHDLESSLITYNINTYQENLTLLSIR